MDDVSDAVLGGVWDNLDGEFASVLVHVFDDLDVLDDDGVDYIFHIRLFMINFFIGKLESRSVQHIKLLPSHFSSMHFSWIQRKGIQKLGYPILMFQVHLLVLQGFDIGFF